MPSGGKKIQKILKKTVIPDGVFLFVMSECVFAEGWGGAFVMLLPLLMAECEGLLNVR
jgi:hypothetical protein